VTTALNGATAEPQTKEEMNCQYRQKSLLYNQRRMSTTPIKLLHPSSYNAYKLND